LVESLQVHAQVKPVNNSLPLAWYYNAADLMLKQVWHWALPVDDVLPRNVS